jgi:hypothetical protein
MPPEEDNGVSYLKLPLNVLGKDDHGWSNQHHVHSNITSTLYLLIILYAL